MLFSVAGKNSKSPIYILAEEELEVCGFHYSIMLTSVCVYHIIHIAVHVNCVLQVCPYLYTHITYTLLLPASRDHYILAWKLTDKLPQNCLVTWVNWCSCACGLGGGFFTPYRHLQRSEKGGDAHHNYRWCAG